MAEVLSGTQEESILSQDKAHLWIDEFADVTGLNKEELESGRG